MPLPFLKQMPNTFFIGKVYYRFDELPSTNDWAADLLANPTFEGSKGAAKTRPPEGTVVRAANQTAGRGQLGSQWHSAPDANLLLSIILYPTWLEAQAQFYLSMAVALALHETLTAMAPPAAPGAYRLTPTIKWPNDVYIEDKKVAGILIQNALTGAQLQSSIVGIGLNVNQKQFSPDLPNPGSLALAYGEAFDLDALAERLFECLERWYLQLKAGHRAAILAAYEEKLWRRGQASRFERTADGSVFEGMIWGVSEQGMLRVETEARVEVFDLKGLRVVI